VILKGLLLLGLLGDSTFAQQMIWIPAGPRPNTKGQVENIKGGEVAGAVRAVAPHPTDPDIVYIGAVNGGIWKTTDARADNPHWVSQTDAMPAASIGCLAFDPTDARYKTLVAGIGWFSSLGYGGARTGLLRTEDGGLNWMAIDGHGALKGLNIAEVAPRGRTIVLAANNEDNPQGPHVGIWRSRPDGIWEQISGKNGGDLPWGPSYDLAVDPTNPRRLFTNGGFDGIYRSDGPDDASFGERWVKVSNAAMDNLLTNHVNPEHPDTPTWAFNVRIAVGRHDDVYVAIVNHYDIQTAQGKVHHYYVAGLFRSPDGGTSWVQIEPPRNADSDLHPGGQAELHLAMAADPGSGRIVYMAGDRQQVYPDATGQQLGPNSIGARDYSGISFRGDFTPGANVLWSHLTHRATAAVPGGGTAHFTAPHADARALAVAADRSLLEGCDGGIYRRTRPLDNAGDWFSMNGDLHITEFHAVAWDSVAHLLMGGAQDTGTPEQRQEADDRLESVSTGDGGVVAVDDMGTPGVSVRYSSYFGLGTFIRRVYHADTGKIEKFEPALIEGVNPPEFTPQFYTPIRLNAVQPRRIVFGAANAVYESLDQGETINKLLPPITVNGVGPNPIAYGARGNADILYVGSGSSIYVRGAAPPAPLTKAEKYGGGYVVGITLDPRNPRSAFAVDPNRVFHTNDRGDHWDDITGRLASLGPGTLRSVAFATHNDKGAILVGSDLGVFSAHGPDFNAWAEFGHGLPKVPVFHLEFDPRDRLILAGTFGRGAWLLRVDAPAPPQ
jgi:hypothetical protein